MKKISYKFLLIVLFALSGTAVFAQPYSIGTIIKNPPTTPIILGIVQGDNFTAIDSTFAKNGLIRFTFPTDAKTGMYRLILGYTKYAKVMNEPPQQLDFIFNKEDVVLETNYKHPESETRVIQSAENEIWYAYKAKEFEQQLTALEQEVNYYWANDDTDKAIKKATEYNQLQIEKDLFITETAKEFEGRFASRLIGAFREPLLDGYLTEVQRKELFKKEYFKSVDFTDESLINSQAYTDNVFKYLVSYNRKGLTQEQREQEYIKAVDIILANTNQNKKVYTFILEYLKHGFEVLKLGKLVNYISEKQQANS